MIFILAIFFLVYVLETEYIAWYIELEGRIEPERREESMKRFICIALAMMLSLFALNAFALIEAEPGKGDVNGEIAAKIDEALRNGIDPATIIKVQNGPVTDSPAVTSPETDDTSCGIVAWWPAYGESAYAQFRAYALRYYNNTTYIRDLYSTFESYFSHVMTTEYNIYRSSYGVYNGFTFDEFLLWVIRQGYMPAI